MSLFLFSIVEISLITVIHDVGAVGRSDISAIDLSTISGYLTK